MSNYGKMLKYLNGGERSTYRIRLQESHATAGASVQKCHGLDHLVKILQTLK